MPVPRRVPPSTTSLSSSVSSLPSQSVPTACRLKMETCRSRLSSLASLGTAALPTNLFQRLCNHMPCLLSRRRGGCCAFASMTAGCLGSVPLLPSSDPSSRPVAPHVHDDHGTAPQGQRRAKAAGGAPASVAGRLAEEGRGAARPGLDGAPPCEAAREFVAPLGQW